MVSVMIAVGLITLNINTELFRQGESVRTKGYEQTLYFVRDSIVTSYLNADSIANTLNVASNTGNQNLKSCLNGTADCKIWETPTPSNNQLVVLSPSGNIVNDPTAHGAEIYGLSAQFFNCTGGTLCPNFEIQRGICNKFGSGSCTAQFYTYFVPICPPAATCKQPPIRLKADLNFSTGSAWVLNSKKFYVDVPLGP